MARGVNVAIAAMGGRRVAPPHVAHDRGTRPGPNRAPRWRAHRLPRPAAAQARIDARPCAGGRGRSAAATVRRARRLPRGAAIDVQAPPRATGRSARSLSVGRRRARQELPHGQLFRDGAAAPEDARAFPRVHALRARGTEDAQERGRSAGDRRGAHRPALAARLLRRVPRRGRRRRDDPRAPARRAVHRGRRVRDDVQLSAGRRSIRTASSARISCRRSSCSTSGSTWSRWTAASITGCGRWSMSRRSWSRTTRGPRPPWRRPSTRCARVPTSPRSS